MKYILIFLITVVMILNPSAFDDDFGNPALETIRRTEISQTIETDEEPEDSPAEVSENEKLLAYINNIFDGRNVYLQDIVSGVDPEINGFISNIQSAPFDSKLLSFEVTQLNNPSVKLVLYHTESQFLVQISSVESYDQNIRNLPFPVKDRGVKWHPEKNILVFQSNGYMNRSQLFMVEIIDPYLMDEKAVKISRIDLKEPRGTINQCLHPEFNSNGNDLFFSVRIQKEDKKQRYNRSSNIAMIRDIFKYKSNGYNDVPYEVLFNRPFDQIKPVCSPTDPDVFAFVSYTREFREGFGYAEYNLVVYNLRTRVSGTIERLNGFRDYPYQWSPSGNIIYFTKAAPLAETPRSFRDDRINKINLHAAKIILRPSEIAFDLLRNEASDVILGDVATKDYGIAFIDDDNLFMAKYDPYESIFKIDMEKWRSDDGVYIKQLPIRFENDFPVLADDAFYFLKYEYFKDAVVSTISRIPYEPLVDEEAERAREERRARRAERRAEREQGAD